MWAFVKTIVFKERIVLNEGTPKMTKETKDLSVVNLAEKINSSVLKLYGSFLSDDGKRCDYRSLGKSKLFTEFVELTNMLKFDGMDLGKLSEDERKCFALNLYNAGVIHATVKLGPPNSWGTRTQFFHGVGYQVGDLLFTLDDLEHGILRSNAKHPMFGYQFGKSDPRVKLILKKLDPRIHFALVCGSKGCPPIRIYKTETLEYGLKAAALYFFSYKENYALEGNTFYLSKILSWYKHDFGKTDEERLKWIAGFLSEEQRVELNKALTTNFTIKYNAYDWDLNGDV